MFYERLKSACKNANTTVTATLKAIGIGTANGTYWKNGSIPSSDIVVKLAEFLNISTDYLLMGKEYNIITDDTQELITNYNAVDIVAKAMIRERARTLAELAVERTAQEAEKSKLTTDIQFVPAADEAPEHEEEFYIDLCDLPASAGSGVYLHECYTEPLQIKRTAIAERANYAIRVSGNSMETKFYDGDIVLVKTCPYVEIGEIGIFIVNGEGFIKKRGEDRLISLNPECDDIFIRAYDTVYCRGRVLGKAEIVE